MAVVKGDGYGHGIAEATDAFVASGAQIVAVGTIHEAATVRSRFPGLRVVLLEDPDMSELSLLHELSIEVLVRSVDAASLRDHAPPVGLHLDIDTGIGRGGLSSRAALEVAAAARPNVVGACVQVPTAPAEAEIDRLRSLLDAIGRRLARSGTRPLLHIGGSECMPCFHRLRGLTPRIGRLLYGIHPRSARDRIDVAPGFAWTTCARALPSGETLGYDRRSVAGARVELTVGFADGLPASADRWPVVVDRRRVEVDTVFMDRTVAVGDRPLMEPERALLLGADGTSTIEPREIADLLGIPTSAVLLLPRSRRVAVQR